MAIIILLLAVVIGLVSLACWIAVLIRMFQDNVLYAILGIICPLWAFIWGWMHKTESYLPKVMPIWTIAFLGNIVLNIISRVVLAN